MRFLFFPSLGFLAWEIVLRRPQLFFPVFLGTVLWAASSVLWVATRGAKIRDGHHFAWPFIVFGAGFTLSALLFLLFVERALAKHLLLAVIFVGLAVYLKTMAADAKEHQKNLWQTAWLAHGMMVASFLFFSAGLYGLLVFLRVSVPVLLAVQAGALTALAASFFNLHHPWADYWKSLFLFVICMSEVFWALTLFPITPLVASAVFSVFAIWFLELLKMNIENKISVFWLKKSAALSFSLLFLILATARWV